MVVVGIETEIFRKETLFNLEMDHLWEARERKGLGFDKWLDGGFIHSVMDHWKRTSVFCLFVFGNIINLDVYNVEFAVYISGILMETSEGNGLYRYGALKNK